MPRSFRTPRFLSTKRCLSGHFHAILITQHHPFNKCSYNKTTTQVCTIPLLGLRNHCRAYVQARLRREVVACVLRPIRCISWSSIISSHPFTLPSASDTSERWVLYTATSVSESCNGAIVGPACELLLHGLREYRTLHIRIGGSLLGKFAVEIGCIKCIGLIASVYCLKSD